MSRPAERPAALRDSPGFRADAAARWVGACAVLVTLVGTGYAGWSGVRSQVGSWREESLPLHWPLCCCGKSQRSSCRRRARSGTRRPRGGLVPPAPGREGAALAVVRRNQRGSWLKLIFPRCALLFGFKRRQKDYAGRCNESELVSAATLNPAGDRPERWGSGGGAALPVRVPSAGVRGLRGVCTECSQSFGCFSLMGRERRSAFT